LSEKGDPVTLENMEPVKNIVYSVDGQQLPFDITNKTVKELREMGFKDLLTFDMQHDPIKGGA
jgi:hypothetical protein